MVMPCVPHTTLASLRVLKMLRNFLFGNAGKGSSIQYLKHTKCAHFCISNVPVSNRVIHIVLGWTNAHKLCQNSRHGDCPHKPRLTQVINQAQWKCLLRTPSLSCFFNVVQFMYSCNNSSVDSMVLNNVDAESAVCDDPCSNGMSSLCSCCFLLTGLRCCIQQAQLNWHFAYVQKAVHHYNKFTKLCFNPYFLLEAFL